MNQIEYAAKMVEKALPFKGFYRNGKLVIRVRGVHYYIVAHLEPENMIPGKGSELRPYENTLQECNMLGRNIVKARLRGLTPWDIIFDNKNPEIDEAPNPRKFDVGYRHIIEDGGSINVNCYNMYLFDDFINSITIKPNFTASRFTSQWYQLAMVTEKDTVAEMVAPLCDRHGAHKMVFGGQHSVTRIHEICEIAQSRHLPLCVFFIADLDPAGWDMTNENAENCFLNRVNQIYYHPYNKVIRVALTREQVKTYNLPPSFEIKEKISEKQKQRFIRETGSNMCVELDALDTRTIKELLEIELNKISGIHIDSIKNRRLEKKARKKIKETLNAFDVEPYRERYDDIHTKQHELCEKVEQFKESVIEELKQIRTDTEEIKREIKDQLYID